MDHSSFLNTLFSEVWENVLSRKRPYTTTTRA
jgi:hypothetical protein